MPQQRRVAVVEYVLIAAEALIAGAVVVAVILIGSAATSRTNPPVVGSVADDLPGSSAVNTLFNGIPQRGTTLGSASAPVTMLVFIDPECLDCRDFITGVLPTIIKKYVPTGTLRIEIEPGAVVRSRSVDDQAAELAAAEQDKAFNYAYLLYYDQGRHDSGSLDGVEIAAVAKSIPGLRVNALLNARTSAAVRAAQTGVDDLVATDRITRFPTLYIGKTGSEGVRLNVASASNETTVAAAINDAAGRSDPTRGQGVAHPNESRIDGPETSSVTDSTRLGSRARR